MRHTQEQKQKIDHLERDYAQLVWDRNKYTPEQYAGLRKSIEREYSDLNLNNWKAV